MKSRLFVCALVLMALSTGARDAVAVESESVDPHGALAFVAESAVAVATFTPAAIVRHAAAHGSLWKEVHCAFVGRFDCMYSGYFGVKPPLFLGETGDAAGRVLMGLMGAALTGDANEGADTDAVGWLSAALRDDPWTVAVLLHPNPIERLALGLAPFPGGSDRVSDTPLITWRFILPAADPSALELEARAVCAARVEASWCDDAVRFSGADEWLIVDVGLPATTEVTPTTTMAHERVGLATWEAFRRGPSDLAVYVRLDLLSAFQRATLWQNFRENAAAWQPADAVFAEAGRVRNGLDAIHFLEARGNAGFSSFTLALQGGEAGWRLSVVASATEIGQRVLDAMLAHDGQVDLEAGREAAPPPTGALFPPAYMVPDDERDAAFPAVLAMQGRLESSAAYLDALREFPTTLQVHGELLTDLASELRTVAEYDEGPPINVAFAIDEGLLRVTFGAGDVGEAGMTSPAGSRDPVDALPLCWHVASRWGAFAGERMGMLPQSATSACVRAATELLDAVAATCPADAEAVAALIRGHADEARAWAAALPDERREVADAPECGLPIDIAPRVPSGGGVGAAGAAVGPLEPATMEAESDEEDSMPSDGTETAP